MRPRPEFLAPNYKGAEKLKGKAALITGGDSGIGRSVAVLYAREGADVAIVYLPEEQPDAEETRQYVEREGGRCLLIAGDVKESAFCREAVEKTVAEFGRLDVLVNNAGIVKDGLLLKVKDGQVVGKMGLDQWNAVIGVNLTGVFLCGREAAERMVKLGNGGVIVNISSISKDGNVGQTNYTATKAGVAAMAVTWAKELARYGIRTGAIAPGFCATDILSGMTPETLAKVTAPVPLKRLGEPNEIAQTAVFIVENDFFTGRTIAVDGGLRL
ncbi:MAG: SDR family oxidoreductase [Acidobacteria bacterium]|nr:SDR family oxidoreductase [Acidobacteriota bacterium]